MRRVLANAVVTEIKPKISCQSAVFSVQVWGLEPHDYTRTYEIEAKSDIMAAQQGIQLFTDEMDALDLEKD
jgi:hypothetical protein